MCTCPPCWQKEDGEKESLTDNEEGAGKYQSVDKGGVSNSMQIILKRLSAYLHYMYQWCTNFMKNHIHIYLYHHFQFQFQDPKRP